jgi:hypothetical protein
MAKGQWWALSDYEDVYPEAALQLGITYFLARIAYQGGAMLG